MSSGEVNLQIPSFADSTVSDRGIVVFSGGSAANSLVDAFNAIMQKRNCTLSYILPISDNGGSSSELIRVFGGPGIGDIRSRLVRLIPPPQRHVHSLLNHRLSSISSSALEDWQSIVSGTSPIWAPIPSANRELLRSMLNHVNFEILKRARPPHSTFNFSNASVGNLFLTGARLFIGSFESAIHLLGLICGISEHVSVIPAINSNFSHHVSAGLADGTVIAGQNAISHPSAPTALPERSPPTPRLDGHNDLQAAPQTTSQTSAHLSSPPLTDSDPSAPEDAHLPYSLPTLRQPAIHFSKTDDEDLPSPIQRIWYINPYGQEIAPHANTAAVTALRNSSAIIYSIGSLYTSIVPCLILRGIGEAIARVNANDKVIGATARDTRLKILILNGSVDRETGPKDRAMGAAGYVAAIARAGEESRGFRGGDVAKETWRRYVTHVIYLEGEGAPKVGKATLSEAGIECVRCWAEKREDGGSGLRYENVGLVGALEAILGKGERSGERSRRNTMEGTVR